MKETESYIGIIKFLILIGAGLFMISCGKDNSEFIVKHIDLPPFDTIELNAVFDVELMEDDHYSLQIKGAKEVIEDLTYAVENQRLIIDNENSKLWLHPKNSPPALIITGKGITRIDVKETCNIRSLNTITTDTFGIVLGGKLNIASLLLDCNLFYYWNSSPNGGQLTLKGQSELVGIYNSTLMAVDASQLICELATVETSSKSEVRVFVRKKLDYSITGTGNIYLSGNPDEIVAHQLSSTGRLIH